MTGLRLLASFPKSGNTWVRAFLTALVRSVDAFDINALEGPIGSSRPFFDDALEIETSDLLPDEERRLRPLAHRAVASQDRESFPIKTHDAWLIAPGASEPPFPREAIRAVILIVRDPRDVAPSLASYYALAIDEAIEVMSRPNFSSGTSKDGLRPQLPQLISSWSGHTMSWLESGLCVELVRYEDLVSRPLQTFAAVARALNCTASADQLVAAIEAVRFERLQADERRKGFRESSPNGPSVFFDTGTAGGWRRKLTAAQADRIVNDHGVVMRKLGYVD